MTVTGTPITRGPLLLVFALGHQVSQLLSARFAEAPLTPDEFGIYSALNLVAPCTPTFLATTLGMRQTTLSNYLRRMEAAGHLRRRRNPADGRSTLIRLTASGVRVTEACFPAFVEAIEPLTERLGDRQASVLAAMEYLSDCLAGTLAELAVEPAAARPG